MDKIELERERVYVLMPKAYPYKVGDVLDVLNYFFACYEHERDEIHPNISNEQLQRIINIMPFENVESMQKVEYKYKKYFRDYEIEAYYDMIDRYFTKRYRNCDYRINHFFSGRIREIINYELNY